MFKKLLLSGAFICSIQAMSAHAYYNVFIFESNGEKLGLAYNVPGFDPDNFELESTNGDWRVKVNGPNDTVHCDVTASSPLYRDLQIAASQVRDMTHFMVGENPYSSDDNCTSLYMVFNSKATSYTLNSPFTFYHAITTSSNQGSVVKQFGTEPQSEEANYFQLMYLPNNNWRVNIYDNDSATPTFSCDVPPTSPLVDDVRTAATNIQDIHSFAAVKDPSSGSPNCTSIFSSYQSND